MNDHLIVVLSIDPNDFSSSHCLWSETFHVNTKWNRFSELIL